MNALEMAKYKQDKEEIKGTIMIKIISNLYKESLLVTLPNIELRPKEKGGEVILQQEDKPCIVVDIGPTNVCTITNLGMILRGPNETNKKILDKKYGKEDFKFQTRGGQQTMIEFFNNFEDDEILCCILLKSGKLILKECSFSLDGMVHEPYRKVPCIIALEGTSIEMNNCKLKGDKNNVANTAGIVALNSNL